MKIGFIVNGIDTELADYTTTCLAVAATNLDHEVWYMGVGDLSLDLDEKPYGQACRVPLRKYRSRETYLKVLRNKQSIRHRVCIADLDVLLLRNDPADDVIKRPWARLAGINFGRLAIRHGVIVLNDPNGLAQAVNKMYLETFPEEVRPRALISRNRNDIKAFITAQKGWAILKPLTGSGGRNVFLVRPQDGVNLNQMIDSVASEGYIIAEEYLPEAREGDTRLFLLNGSPLLYKKHYAALRRVRKTGDSDIRSNMTAGAIGKKAKITDSMLQLAEKVRPKLIQDGMFFVGLDIVGDKLLEINTFSPGGLHEAGRLEGVPFSNDIINALERKVEHKKKHAQGFNNIEIATL
jgi:glutathione synthase